MKRLALAVLTLATVMLACSCRTSVTPLVSPGASRKSGKLRFSQTTEANVKDVPWFMALDALRAQGYEVEVVAFAKSSLIPPALEKGEIDVADTNVSPVWAAVSQGADICTVVGKSNMTYVLAVAEGINTCRQLDDKSVTFATRQSAGYVMFEDVVARDCPAIKPDIMLISGSVSRVAALQAGEVAAAYLDLEDWLYLERSTPGKFHVLVDFGLEFPQALFTVFSTTCEWAQKNPDVVRDFVRALLAAQRSVLASPDKLRDGIVKHLAEDPAVAAELARVYLAANTWDPNGSLTPDRIEYTLQLLREGDILAADLQVADVADLTYLNAVLTEMGRQ